MALVEHTQSQERRSHPRHKVFKGARAVFNTGQSVMDCIMRDVSAGGARLACDQAAQIPDQFELIIMTEREMRDAKVVWRKFNLMGVEFLSPPRRAFHRVL